MTIVLPRFVAGTNSTPAGVTQAQYYGRICPGADFDNGIRTQLIAIPWSLTSDGNGVAYPAGIVGVVGGVHYDPTSGQSYSDYIKDQWANHEATPVPGILPAGYTARLVRPDANYFQQTLIRSATGDATPLWYPSAFAGGGGGIQPNAVWTSLGTASSHYWGTIGATIGFRYFNIQWLYSSNLGPGDFGFTPWGGTMSLTVSHNANGTDPGNADGDTNNYSTTFSYGDFTPTLVTVPFRYWSWLSSAKAAGAINPKLGVVSYFKVNASYPTDTVLGPFDDYHLSQAGGAGSTGAQGTSDLAIIPYPFTVTGNLDLIAPGGTVT